MTQEWTNEHLEIEYPCDWEYKIIGVSEENLRQAVVEVIRDAEHSLTASNASRTGKYCSMKLEMVVQSEAERVGIFESLRTHEDVIMVL